MNFPDFDFRPKRVLLYHVAVFYCVWCLFINWKINESSKLFRITFPSSTILLLKANYAENLNQFFTAVFLFSLKIHCCCLQIFALSNCRRISKKLHLFSFIPLCCSHYQLFYCAMTVRIEEIVLIVSKRTSGCDFCTFDQSWTEHPTFNPLLIHFKCIEILCHFDLY